jgi:hypothetical protein
MLDDFFYAFAQNYNPRHGLQYRALRKVVQEIRLRKSLISLALGFTLLFAASLQAQEFDGALGFGTVKAPAGSNGLPSESGGLYMSFSGNARLWMHHHLGFGGEVAPRLRQAPYSTGFGTLGYRPIFYDFNAVYGGTWLKKKIGGDVMAGIGGQDNRFYTGSYNCTFTGCTNYESANHFAWHFGADVVHNGGEFSGFQVFNNSNASRYAISIGYTFAPGF